MKKTFNFSIIFTLMILFSLPVMAEDVFINFNEEKIEGGNTSNITHVVGDFTFTATKESGSSFPAHHSQDKDLRLYAKNKLVISSEKAFNSIVFNISTRGLRQWAELLPDKGEVKVNKENKTVTWTTPEPLQSVEFTVGAKNTYGTGTNQNGQFFFNSVKITVADENTEIVQAPTFSHETGNYLQPFNLELSAPEGYKIYYTLDLTIPNNTKELYTAPIPITQTTIVKAVAYSASGKKSFEVTHTYTFPALRSNINEMKGLAPKSVAKLTLDNAVVLAVAKDRIFIADATGGILFYKTGLDYTPGTVLNGSIIGMYDTFHDLPQIVKAGEDTNNSQIEATTGAPATAKEITLDELENPANLCTLVKISGVTIDIIDNKLYVIHGDKRFEIYNNTLKGIPDGTEIIKGSTNNTITAIVSIYDGKYQLLPTTTDGLQIVTTGIEKPFAHETKSNSEALYNIAGQRVNAGYKGMVVKNGRKYIKK